ncbi:class I SAM-dependent methyltransferase [Natronomonas sp. EA1]|uniref:class I SAM-dependent methyltransferase n=1 Tax=Natronomonas sp. EA1 TaxID=3421655 RepID=UPI003EBD2C37
MRDVSLFDRFARAYEAAMPAADPAVFERGFAFADRDIERVVDVGGGTGRAARHYDAVVVDPARGMLREGARKGIEGIRGDGARLPLKSESVDAVTIVDALHHFAEPISAIAEAHRVLKPGGVLLIREFDPTPRRGQLLVALEHAVGFDSRFWSPDELMGKLDRAGFTSFCPDRAFTYTVVGVR